jgi:hypothetical protein
MNKEFVPYKMALELKELGFDEPTSFYWEDDIIKPLPMKDEVGGFNFNRHSTADANWICAPTINQVLRWFEEKHGMYVEWIIDMWGDNYNVSGDWICYTTFIWQVGKPRPKPHDEVGHGSWNAMALASINEMIFMLEDPKDDNKDELIDKSIQFDEQQRRLIQMMLDDQKDGLYNLE